MNKNNLSLNEKIKKLNREYPLVPHTNAGRLSSMVRRMKAEKEMDIPINLRSGFAISTKTGKSANKMNEKRWDEFYDSLSGELKTSYPELYQRIFSIPEIINVNLKNEKY